MEMKLRCRNCLCSSAVSAGYVTMRKSLHAPNQISCLQSHGCEQHLSCALLLTGVALSSLVALFQIPEMSSQDQEVLCEAHTRSGEESYFPRGSEDTSSARGYGQSPKHRDEKAVCRVGWGREGYTRPWPSQCGNKCRRPSLDMTGTGDSP